MTNDALILQKLSDMQKSMDEKFLSMQKSMDERFDAVDKRFDAVDKRFDAVDKRLDTLEEKVDRIEETQNEHTDALKTIIDWAEDVGRFTQLEFGKAQ